MTVPSEGLPEATAKTTRRPRAAKEAVLMGAVEVARDALVEVVEAENIGEYEGARVEADRLVTHYFASTQPGYRGWRWAVTLSRPPRGRTATVCEVALLPGEDAMVAPSWLPWEERLEPTDLGAGDVLPYDGQDVRLVPGFTDTTENADQLEIEEVGLGRVRVLSPEGFDRAAQRWYEGASGPHTPEARAATSQCSTCGFFMKLAGTPRRLFGVCANEWSPDDGRVVSVDHGCGAHSETDVSPRPPLWNPPETVLDESELESFLLPRRADAGDATEPAEDATAEDATAEDATVENAADENEADENAEPDTDTGAQASAEDPAEEK